MKFDNDNPTSMLKAIMLTRQRHENKLVATQDQQDLEEDAEQEETDLEEGAKVGKTYSKKADKDYDEDGEVESSEDEWKGSRDKAIKKNKKKGNKVVQAGDVEEEKVNEASDGESYHSMKRAKQARDRHAAAGRKVKIKPSQYTDKKTGFALTKYSIESVETEEEQMEEDNKPQTLVAMAAALMNEGVGGFRRDASSKQARAKRMAQKKSRDHMSNKPGEKYSRKGKEAKRMAYNYEEANKNADEVLEANREKQTAIQRAVLSIWEKSDANRYAKATPKEPHLSQESPKSHEFIDAHNTQKLDVRMAHQQNKAERGKAPDPKPRPNDRTDQRDPAWNVPKQ